MADLDEVRPDQMDGPDPRRSRHTLRLAEMAAGTYLIELTEWVKMSPSGMLVDVLTAAMTLSDRRKTPAEQILGRAAMATLTSLIRGRHDELFPPAPNTAPEATDGG